MSKTEIIAELPNLSVVDLSEVQAKLDELLGDAWLNQAGLSDEDKAALNLALIDYGKSPHTGSGWPEVKQRIETRLNP